MKPPKSDPSLDLFRDGLAILSVDGEFAGHIATEVGKFWGFSRLCGLQWDVRMVVVWADGTKTNLVEDYPPWSYVTEMKAGYLDWINGPVTARHQRYDVRFLPSDEARASRDRLGITLKDF